MNTSWRTHWCHSGRLEAEYSHLRSMLLPESGKAKTQHGEWLRCASNIYHEFYNNANINFSQPHFQEMRKALWSIRGLFSPELRRLLRKVCGGDATENELELVMDAVIEVVGTFVDEQNVNGRTNHEDRPAR